MSSIYRRIRSSSEGKLPRRIMDAAFGPLFPPLEGLALELLAVVVVC